MSKTIGFIGLFLLIEAFIFVLATISFLPESVNPYSRRLFEAHVIAYGFVGFVFGFVFFVSLITK